VNLRLDGVDGEYLNDMTELKKNSAKVAIILMIRIPLKVKGLLFFVCGGITIQINLMKFDDSMRSFIDTTRTVIIRWCAVCR